MKYKDYFPFIIYKCNITNILLLTQHLKVTFLQDFKISKNVAHELRLA